MHAEGLGLRLQSLACRRILETGSFPRLRVFSFTLSVYGLLLPSFLNRHQSVVNLELYRDSSAPTVPSISVRLPNLRSFRGPSFFFTSIVAQAPLSNAPLSWNFGEDFGPIIDALERHSKESLVSLTCMRRGNNVDLINYISTHIPNIQSLHIKSPGRSINHADGVSVIARQL